MTCNYCIDKNKMHLNPGDEWECKNCGEVWIADMQGVWIKDRL